MTKNANDQISLQVVFDHEVVFESNGKWLYPLFDLEEFLTENPFPMEQAFVHDKVIGKAAAMLLIRLGARQIHGELMSELADQALTRAKVAHTYDRCVPRIDCQTEEILLEIDNPEEAYKILCQRAQRC